MQYDGCTIEDLGLDFVVPGYQVELIKNGKYTQLTIHNLHVYVRVLTHWLLYEGVAKQMEALREGFDSVFPSRNLRVFQPDELEQVFCGSPKVSSRFVLFNSILIKLSFYNRILSLAFKNS